MNGTLEKTIDWIKEELVAYECGNRIRIGNPHDGGYVLLESCLSDTPVLYSAGIGNDVGFELDFIAQAGADAHLYDPTISSLPIQHPRFFFYKKELPFRGTYFVPGSVLKMDIEWAEWDFFYVLPVESLRCFSQIVCEFHFVHTEPRQGLTAYFERFYREKLDRVNCALFQAYFGVLRKLNAHFRIFHVHPNNSLPLIHIGGQELPPLLEVSFVNRTLVSPDVRLYDGSFPIAGLDSPNKPDRPDIEWGANVK